MKALYEGPAIDDPQALAKLPEELALMLRARNGFLIAGGGFHVRGACLEPKWHSLRSAWEGEFALNALYPSVEESDIPIAEDCFGDQYLIRNRKVLHLFAESGEVDDLGLSWQEFAGRTEEKPVEFLGLACFVRFLEGGGRLEPGQLLSVYPPFVVKECVDPSLRPVPALELRSYLADFAGQIRDVPDGARIQIKIT